MDTNNNRNNYNNIEEEDDPLPAHLFPPLPGLEAVDAGVANAVRQLFATIEITTEPHCRSLLITSAGPGEGKSMIAWLLARAAAEAGHSILLVEADFRRPIWHDRFGLNGVGSFVEILSNRLEMPKPAPGALQLLVSGKPSSNPTRLLRPALLQHFFDRTAGYDHVILDGPPLLMTYEATPLAKAVDGVVLILGAGLVTESEASRSITFLQRIGAHVLGTVLNRYIPTQSANYERQSFRYGYGYGDGIKRPRDD